jgi:S1-C subfamily serine protease
MLTAFMVEGIELVDEDYPNDLVLFRHDGSGFPHGMSVSINGAPHTAPPRPARLSAELPADGEAIAISGYPLEAPSLTTTSGHIATNWAHFDMRGALVHQYFGDITVNPGNSGGPAYRLSDGAVIGVCSDVLLTDVVESMGGPSPAGKHAAGLATITPSTAVRALMLKSGVQPLDP